MKKSVAFLATAVLSLSMLFSGCGGGDKKAEGPKADNAAKELTVYTARSESLNNAVIKNFEKDTGIKVNVVVAGTGEVVKRVASEKANPLGDVLWAGSEAMLASKKELFMDSPELTLPHRFWQERDFVKTPLAEIMH